MKRSVFTSVYPACIMLLLALGMLSCNQNKEPGPGIVAGHLPELAGLEISTNTGNQEINISIDTEGRFQLELDLYRDSYLWFSGINTNLFLVQGDSIFIASGDPGAQKLVFTGGESGLINTWYQVKDAKLSTLLDTVDIRDYYSQDPASFKKLNTRVISEFNNMLDLFCQENPEIGEYFIALEKASISHYWYYELNVYHIENKAYTGHTPDLPADFYDYLETVSLNDTLLFQFEGYRYFLYSWLDLQIHLQDKKLKGVDKTHQIFDIAEESFTEPEILSDVIWENLRMQNNRMAVNEEVIARAAAMGVPKNRLAAASDYMERLQTLAAGNQAPDFEILDINGHKATLKDFSGKYLLMDIWSHSCGPCIREIPRLEDLKHDFQERNLEIIAICLSPEEDWRNKMAELDLPGEGQYRLELGWGSEFNDHYLKGSGVPVYILIDPEGRFVNARAPYPSQGMRALLEEIPI